MMEQYVIINGRKFKKGYTTGSCAAAASKAAVMMLHSGKIVDSVEIDTPKGMRLNLLICDVSITPEAVECAVVKDSGDDPDVTNGVKVFSEARFTDQPGIRVRGGEGIGIVTLPGLKVEVGKPAINPVPMEMIRKEVKEVLGDKEGVEITIHVPGGEEIAKKTYNPRLGIVGGISVLGTTGIVEPMSEEAWKDSLALELSVKASEGKKEAVFIFGSYGEDFTVNHLNIRDDHIVKISNFVGFMLEKAVEYGFEKIVLAGHAGKLVKVAAGIFHTHSRVADARMEILAAYAALEGASHPLIDEIYHCITTEAAVKIINDHKLTSVYDRIVANVSASCEEYTFHKLQIGAVLFDNNNSVLAGSTSATEILNEIRRQYE